MAFLKTLIGNIYKVLRQHKVIDFFCKVYALDMLETKLSLKALVELEPLETSKKAKKYSAHKLWVFVSKCQMRLSVQDSQIARDKELQR